MQMRWLVLCAMGLSLLAVVYTVGLRALHGRTLYPFDQTVFRDDGYVTLQVPVANADPLTAYVRKSKRPDAPVILFFMGNSGSLAGFQSFLEPHEAADRTILAMGYRGGGGIPGKPSESGLKADAVGLFDAVGSLVGATHGPVVVHGYSLGTGLAIHIAATRRADGVVLDAPLTRACSLFLKSFGPGACALPFFQKWDGIAEAPQIAGPVLIHHGAKDRAVPLNDAQALAASIEGRVVFEVYEDAGHTDLPADPRYAPSMSAFIDMLKRR
jgi:uncharacterized protein